MEKQEVIPAGFQECLSSTAHPQEVLQSAQEVGHVSDEDLNSQIGSDLDSQMDIDLDYVDEGQGPDTTTGSDGITPVTPVLTDEEAHEIAMGELRNLRKEKERALVYAELKGLGGFLRLMFVFFFFSFFISLS